MEKGFIGLFFAVLLLPMAQMLWPLLPETTLAGVEAIAAPKPPGLSLRTFVREEFQKGVSEWLRSNFGFRGHLIRSDNQLNFSLFREISFHYGSHVIVGRNNVLFEKTYIDGANGRLTVPRPRLEFLARQILRLQRLLALQGKQFLVLLTPSKASFETKEIPDRFLVEPGRSRSRENADEFAAILEGLGVNLLDSRELLRSWQKESGLEIFPKGGSHWTEYIACRVAAALVEKLRSLGGREYPAVRCEPTVVDRSRGPFDLDLADLTNVWTKDLFRSPLPYVDLTGFTPAPGVRPRVHLVGGSFLVAILAHLERQSIIGPRDFFYYYERRYRVPEGTDEPLNKRKIRWKDDVLKNDVFILEINEIFLHRAGKGFLRDALLHLR